MNMRTVAALLAALFASTRVVAAPACTALVNVTVVATDREHLTAHQTVLVWGDRIEAVSVSEAIKPPRGCRLIDGQGRYLIPGLVDTHVHFFGYSRGGEGDLGTENAILRMLLANGVTTALVMEGSPAILHLRAELAAGHRTGPTLMSAGPMIQAADTGAPPGRKTFSTPAEVRREVEDEKRLGYDFVKVHGAMPQRPTPRSWRPRARSACRSSATCPTTSGSMPRSRAAR